MLVAIRNKKSKRDTDLTLRMRGIDAWRIERYATRKRLRCCSAGSRIMNRLPRLMNISNNHLCIVSRLPEENGSFEVCSARGASLGVGPKHLLSCRHGSKSTSSVDYPLSQLKRTLRSLQVQRKGIPASDISLEMGAESASHDGQAEARSFVCHAVDDMGFLLGIPLLERTSTF